MISAPGDEVNPVAVWTQKPVVSEFLAGWVGGSNSWMGLFAFKNTVRMKEEWLLQMPVLEMDYALDLSNGSLGLLTQ